MFSARDTIIYGIFAICIFLTSIYSMYIFGMNHALFFADSQLLIPFIQKLSFPYSAWILPKHFLFFPDALIYHFFSFITDNAKETIVYYIIAMITITYFTLIFTVQKRMDGTSISLYISIWAMLLVLFFSSTPFLVQIFAPNGLIGFMIMYYIAISLIFNALYSKYSTLAKLFLFLILTILAFTTPVLTFIFLGIPALILSFFDRRIEYPTDQHLYFDIIVTLSISLGFILQLYFTPFRQNIFMPTNYSQLLEILYSIHPLLLATSLLGILYMFFYSFSKDKSGNTVCSMRIASLGSILGLICVFAGVLDITTYLLFIFFFTLSYAVPHFIITTTSLLTLSNIYSINTFFVLATILTIFILYWNHISSKNTIYSEQIIQYLDQTLPDNKTNYILVPRGMAREITLFSEKNIVAIPYIPNTLEYESFVPDEAILDTYSALVIQKEFKDTILVQQLLSLIGQPSRQTSINDYLIMEYLNGFTMPNAAKLATYTTPLGNIIRNTLADAPTIPLPSQFNVNGIPIKEIRLLQDEGKLFIALVFDKNTPIPINTEYTAYTLAPSSSAFRKLASGIRRELPFLSSVLPLEDKNTEFIHTLKDTYIIQNGDIVIPINITNTVHEALTFLSLSIEGSSPTIVLQYPDKPIPFIKE